jgi:hypothetical protein
MPGSESDPLRERLVAWIGKPLEDVVQIDSSEQCRGAIGTTLPSQTARPHARKLSGWAWNDLSDAEPESVVLVNPQGRIFGLANIQSKRDWRGPKEADWRGWVRHSRHRVRYFAYGILAGSEEACFTARDPQ